MARLNTKHVDMRIGIVKVTDSKISQTVCGWHVSRFGRVRPDIGKGFGGVSRGKLSTVDKKTIIILPSLLFPMIWLDICGDKRDSTHWSKRVCLSWGDFSDSYITMKIYVWNLGIL